MSLSVCFLTRNEEQDIARAIRSIKDVADEILVVDTYSADRTAAVAAELGARVHQYAWEEDFGAGRNFTIGKVTGDWILWMNADEELISSSQHYVRDCIERTDV